MEDAKMQEKIQKFITFVHIIIDVIFKYMGFIE